MINPQMGTFIGHRAWTFMIIRSRFHSPSIKIEIEECTTAMGETGEAVEAEEEDLRYTDAEGGAEEDQDPQVAARVRAIR